MRVGSRRFTPRWWATVLYLALALAMLALGRWQLARADEKLALLESAERARATPAVALERVDDIERAAAEHRRVRVEGVWLDGRQLLWDNRAHAGRAGYEVITPLRGADGRLALVNRGWIAPGATRAVLPDVALPASAGRGARVELTGLLSRPSRGFANGEALDPGGRWPRVLQYFDYAAIETALGEPIVAAVVQAQAGDGTGIGGPVTMGADTGAPSDATAPSAETTSGVGSGAEPDDVTRAALLIPNWRPAASGPEKHYGYAFQWFAMAVALTVIFVVVNLSRNESDESEHPPEHDPERRARQ